MTVRMAFNPLPWYSYKDGWHPERAPALPEILTAVKAAGYDAIHAEPPEGMKASAYAKLLAAHGLAPAPGYFQAHFASLEEDNVVERAVTAARVHAELGLNRIFVAEQAFAPERFATPAAGVNADPARLASITVGLGTICEAMVGEGVCPCLHLHVGTWIETVEEAETVLASIPEDLLLIGADTGHTAWTGADPVTFVARHASRIGAVHIKDIRTRVADEAKAQGLSYGEAAARGLWTEPGRGDIDFDGVFQSLRGFDGWFIVEVDVADQPTIEESAKVAADWLRPRLEART